MKNVISDLSEQDIACIHSLMKSHEKNALASDWDADVALYDTDAIRYPPGSSPVIGERAIRSEFDAMESVLSFTHQILDINGGGNFAYLIVEYAFEGVAVGSPEPFKASGRSMVILRRQADNSWKFYRVVWN